MLFRILLFLLFVSSLSANAISYHINGRLGNHLITYLCAKWLSMQYGLPLVYIPFKYSDQFIFHEKEFYTPPFFKQKINIQTEEEIPLAPTSTLIFVNFFKASLPKLSYHTYWNNPDFKKQMREYLKPKNDVKTIYLPKKKLTVLAHVRTGVGFDSPKMVLSHPNKFPPHSFYISAIEKLSSKFKHCPLYVYIMTDDPNPGDIVKQYSNALGHLPNVEFDFRKGDSGPAVNVLEDFFSIPKFDCIIRGNSTFAVAASLLGDYKAVVTAKCHSEDGKVVVDAMNIRLNWDPLLLELDPRVVAEADKNLFEGPYSVVDKNKNPFSQDLHDYLSLGRYWWPDSYSSDYIWHDGEINPEIYSSNYDYDRMLKMSKACTNLCLAYTITGEDQYAEHASNMLRSWFLNSDSRMNPNLNFSQVVPGKNKTSSAGIIEGANFIEVFDASNLIANSKFWDSKDAKGMQKWARDYLEWLLKSPKGQNECSAANNHGSWYDLQVLFFAMYTSQWDLAKEHLVTYTIPRMEKQFTQDGAQPLELSRTKPLHYCMYNLLALYKCAILAEKVGLNIWNDHLHKGLVWICNNFNLEEANKKQLSYLLHKGWEIYQDPLFAQSQGVQNH